MEQVTEMTKSNPPKNIVLYADDDSDDLQLVKDAFDQFSKDVEVITAKDGIEALNYLEEASALDPTPCLIILDINMPRLNGKETLRRIRQMNEYKDVPVVLFTTSSLPMDEEFAQKHNAGFLTKPIDVRQMEIITDRFIEHCTDEIKKKIRRHS